MLQLILIPIPHQAVFYRAHDVGNALAAAVCNRILANEAALRIVYIKRILARVAIGRRRKVRELDGERPAIPHRQGKRAAVVILAPGAGKSLDLRLVVSVQVCFGGIIQDAGEARL